MNDLSKISVVLPSLDPDEKLIAVVNGLLKYGKLLIPFSNQIPKHMKLYELITTRPGEGVFARGQV